VCAVREALAGAQAEMEASQVEKERKDSLRQGLVDANGHCKDGDGMCFTQGCSARCRHVPIAEETYCPESGCGGCVMGPCWLCGQLAPKCLLGAHQGCCGANCGMEVTQCRGTDLELFQRLVEGLQAVRDATDVKTLVTVMRVSVGIEAVQTQACAALVMMVSASLPAAQSKTQARNAGAVEAVVAALRESADHVRLQENAWAALYILICDHPESKARAGTAGAVEAVLYAMQNHTSSAGVLKPACTAFMSLICDHVANRRRALKVNALDMLCGLACALRENADNAGVQEQLCGVMRELKFGNPDDMFMTNAFAARAIEEVVAARPPCAPALWTTARTRTHAPSYVTPPVSKRNCNRLMRAGAIEALVVLMHGHLENGAEQYEACMALGTLTSGNVACSNRARNAGGIEALVAVLHRHVANERVYTMGCRALTHLTQCEADINRAGDAGAVEVAVAAMRKHAGDAVIQEESCVALVMLTIGSY